MSEINKNGFNPNRIEVQHTSAKQTKGFENDKIGVQQQQDASSPVNEALGRSMVGGVDNHDSDMRKLLANPEIANVSDSMYEAAIRAGVGHPEAATFATAEVM